MPDAITSFERRLLHTVQVGLPLCEEPWLEIADQLGESEQTVIDAVQSLLDRGVLRRVGLVPNHYALGYRYNLMLVWNIRNEGVDSVGTTMGETDFVSHCYRRPRHGDEWPFNLFTMIHCRHAAEIDDLVECLRDIAGIHYIAHTALESTRILKKTGLRLKEAG